MKGVLVLAALVAAAAAFEDQVRHGALRIENR